MLPANRFTLLSVVKVFDNDVDALMTRVSVASLPKMVFPPTLKSPVIPNPP